eukprot:TRINITY_DN1315_c0_g1_i1.p1 TRINITY_DN1315_c0_g1~~TRINITY_DN1315_c0_g1_i1.p1  ORF type:complete len:108 (+),score=17.22 TRINITY_DN1315_c0_g1_i1:64-387(+)
MSAPVQQTMDDSAVMVMDACMCCYDGCLCDGSCLGCAYKSTICCLEGQGSCRCLTPTTCIKQQTQLCCLVSGCACPCDSEVPCMLAVLCLTCYPKCGCCKKMGEIKG